MPIQRSGKEASDKRRHTDVFRFESVDQLHHPLVLLIDYIARLFGGREVPFVDRDGAWASDLLSSAVDGRVVAG